MFLVPGLHSFNLVHNKWSNGYCNRNFMGLVAGSSYCTPPHWQEAAPLAILTPVHHVSAVEKLVSGTSKGTHVCILHTHIIHVYLPTYLRTQHAYITYVHTYVRTYIHTSLHPCLSLPGLTLHYLTVHCITLHALHYITFHYHYHLPFTIDHCHA